MGVRVRMTDHAEIRSDERVGREVRNEIARGLHTALRLGVRPGPDLTVEVGLKGGAHAVVQPLWEGGWGCITVK